MLLTTDQIIEEIRGDLDEPIESVWRTTDLITWMNAGINQILSKLKVVRQDWQTRKITSNDGSVTIHDDTYDTSNLRLVSGTQYYTLPPDLVEIRILEPLNQTDKDAGLTFIAKKISDIETMSANRLSAGSSRMMFYYDIIGLDQLRIVPTPAASYDIEMLYVRSSTRYVEGDTIDILPHWALEAVKAYIRYRAFRSVNHPDTNNELLRYKDELAVMASYANPRQSGDPIIVEGVFDDDDVGLIYPVDIDA